MVSGLAARVAKLEGGRKDAFMCVLVHGGLPGDIDHAAAGGSRWERDKGEDLGGFVARVKAAARDSGEKLLVVGGLP